MSLSVFFTTFVRNIFLSDKYNELSQYRKRAHEGLHTKYSLLLSDFIQNWSALYSSCIQKDGATLTESHRIPNTTKGENQEF
jgi:hypothetical protein